MVQRNPQTNSKVVQHIAPSAIVADVTPATGVDCRGFTELQVIIPTGTFVGAASVVITLQESSTVDGVGDAFAPWTYPASSAFPAITTANDAGITLGRVNLGPRKRFIRAVYDYTGNGTTEVSPASVIFVLKNPKDTVLCTDVYAVDA